jgi:N-acetylglutamate synthase-like GNAT family acetyltransferase
MIVRYCPGVYSSLALYGNFYFMKVDVDNAIKIIPYESHHRSSFSELNYAWINRYFKPEEADHRALDDPEKYILNKGGFIFMALYQDTVVGTCALIKIDDSVMELAKMAVSDLAQGKGVGYALGKACIEKGKELGLKKIELLSNTVLAPAIHLYKKLGFVEVPLPVTEYERANIKMELELS